MDVGVCSRPYHIYIVKRLFWRMKDAMKLHRSMRHGLSVAEIRGKEEKEW